MTAPTFTICFQLVRRNSKAQTRNTMEILGSTPTHLTALKSNRGQNQRKSPSR
jgi:hypothetical protein